MAKKRKKEPAVQGALPAKGKQPVALVDRDAYRQLKPVWCFRHMDLRGGAWSWDRADAHQFMKVLERLKEYEQKTWAELSQQDSCGEMETRKLAQAAQQRLCEIRLTTVDVLYKLRIDKPTRVWGYRIEHTLYLLWFDPEHSVYPTSR